MENKSKPDPFFDHDCALCKKRISAESQEKESGSKNIISVTHMVTDRLFWYGMSGIMQFTKDLGLKKDDRLCWNCTIAHRDDYEPAKLVKCSHCDELYQPLWNDEKNPGVYRDGYECNADCYEKDGKLYIGAGYGSKFDCSRFEVYAPVVKAGDQICDKCLDLFMEEKTIFRDRVYR